MKKSFTLYDLCFIFVFLSVFCAILFPSVQSSREASRRMNCQSQVGQIILAAHNYKDVNNCFPRDKAITNLSTENNKVNNYFSCFFSESLDYSNTIAIKESYNRYFPTQDTFFASDCLPCQQFQNDQYFDHVYGSNNGFMDGSVRFCRYDSEIDLMCSEDENFGDDYISEDTENAVSNDEDNEEESYMTLKRYCFSVSSDHSGAGTVPDDSSYQVIFTADYTGDFLPDHPANCIRVYILARNGNSPLTERPFIPIADTYSKIVLRTPSARYDDPDPRLSETDRYNVHTIVNGSNGLTTSIVLDMSLLLRMPKGGTWSQPGGVFNTQTQGQIVVPNCTIELPRVFAGLKQYQSKNNSNIYSWKGFSGVFIEEGQGCVAPDPNLWTPIK